MRPLLACLLVLVACSSSTAEEPRPVKHIPLPKDWARVGDERQISATEDLRILRFSDPTASDTVCVIYRNREFRTAQVICPTETPDLSSFDPND